MLTILFSSRPIGKRAIGYKIREKLHFKLLIFKINLTYLFQPIAKVNKYYKIYHENFHFGFLRIHKTLSQSLLVESTIQGNLSSWNTNKRLKTFATVLFFKRKTNFLRMKCQTGSALWKNFEILCINLKLNTENFQFKCVFSTGMKEK